MTEPLPADIALALQAAADRLGACAGRIGYVATAPSTNDVALRLAAAGAADGTTVLAGAQTAGRGRQGRRWFSPAGAGLYFSLVLRGVGPAPVTLMAGVAVAEGVRAASGLPAEIEWPNDVVIRSASGRRAGGAARKLAGILAEASRLDGAADSVVLGIGINVERAKYPADVARRASSLAAELDGPVDRAAVLVEVLAALARRRRLLAAGGALPMLARWEELAPASRGALVAWGVAGARRSGVTAGIDRDGALLVRSGDGLERLVAGEVHWLAPPRRGAMGSPQADAGGSWRRPV